MEHITKLRNFDAGEILCITGVQGCLGAGGFGVVQCVLHPSLGWIAVKCYPVDKGASARDLVVKQIQNELSALEQANHENILRVYGWAQWEGSIAIVTELMRGGSLRLILADEDVPLHPVLRLRMCKEVSDGTAFIHNFSSTKRLTHGDLKPENILLTEYLHCKVSDFGGAKWATYTGQTTMTDAADSKQQMTRVYAAPERLRKLSCPPKTEQDTFSYGLIVHGVLSRKKPTANSVNVEEFLDGIKRGERPDTDAIDELEESLTTNEEKEIIQELRSVMIRCWQEAPTDRPDMKDVRDQLQQLMVNQKSLDVMRSVGEAMEKMNIRVPERSSNQRLPLSCFSPLTKKFQLDGVCDQCRMKQESKCCNCPRVVLTEYELGRKIQNGTCGAKIYVCSRKGSGKNSKKFAAKVMDPKIYTVADKEIKVLENVHDFDHIVSYYGCHTNRSWSLEKVIVLELCGGNVDQLVKCLQQKRKSESYEELKPISQICGTLLDIDFLKYFQISLIDIFRQSVEGLKCLHGQNIVHRDMKPSNLFLYKRVDGTTIIKISDFGLSRKIPTDASTYLTVPAGTVSFTAPEYFVDQKIKPTKPADIFSLGLCFYYIFTEGHHVYGDGIERDLHTYRIRTGTPLVFKHLLPYYDEPPAMQSEAFEKDRHLTDEQRITACHLLRKMLQFEPDDRPTIEKVKTHPTCWYGEEKKQMIVSLTSILDKKHPKRKIPKTKNEDVVDLDFEQFETSLIVDEESEVQVKMKARAFDTQQQDSKRERYHITAEKHIPECLGQRDKACDDLRHLYRIARNMICYSLEQSPDVQKILKIEKDKEDWEKFLHEFFHAVPQHLINSYNFLEKHYPQATTEPHISFFPGHEIEQLDQTVASDRAVTAVSFGQANERKIVTNAIISEKSTYTTYTSTTVSTPHGNDDELYSSSAGIVTTATRTQSASDNDAATDSTNAEFDTASATATKLWENVISAEESKAIGPKGGEMRVGGCMLEFPEGALDSEVTIKLRSYYGRCDQIGLLTPLLKCESFELNIRKDVAVTLPTCFRTKESKIVVIRKSQDGKAWNDYEEIVHRDKSELKFNIRNFLWVSAWFPEGKLQKFNLCNQCNAKVLTREMEQDHQVQDLSSQDAVFTAQRLLGESNLSLSKDIFCGIPHDHPQDPQNLKLIIYLYDSSIDQSLWIPKTFHKVFHDQLLLKNEDSEVSIKLACEDIEIAQPTRTFKNALGLVRQEQQFLLKKKSEKMIFKEIMLRVQIKNEPEEQKRIIIPPSDSKSSETRTDYKEPSDGRPLPPGFKPKRT